MYLAPFYRFQDYKKSHRHIVIYKLDLMKFIGQMGSWSGHATTCRRQDSSLPGKNFGLGRLNMSIFLVSISDQIAQIPGALGPIKLKSSKSSFVTDMDCGVIWWRQGKYSLPTNIQAGPVFYLARYPSGVNA